MAEVILVYVRLLDEGPDVFRPTTGTLNADDSIELHKTEAYDFGDENWEFLPGSHVFAAPRWLDGIEVLVAARRKEPF